MYKEIKQTSFKPQRPILVWDGDCGFCKFWKTRWQLKTGDKIAYKTYQEIARFLEDIPLKEFKKASKLIEPNGKVYNGPNSAYRSLWYAGNKFWYNLFESSQLFKKVSKHTYNHIAKNRSFYFKLTKFALGDNPRKLKHYWIFYLFLVVLFLFLLLNF
ncbi:thiol-disulfide oxidoreductase DCC family protein [Haloflavibacter putidus]|uniref:Thiol-disulfide oxidoreductase n=1 Tax=Haloflavibacter putidus TaxID=2576776 RepID=A0A507ZPB8_9FLAO|nr:thiol-disulfide oxidoreductase [Haloflavibacter putidus]TQD39390.1 thiol-disulfide oxidoreductase [Haloflavibacter putidus]